MQTRIRMMPFTNEVVFELDGSRRRVVRETEVNSAKSSIENRDRLCDGGATHDIAKIKEWILGNNGAVNTLAYIRWLHEQTLEAPTK